MLHQPEIASRVIAMPSDTNPDGDIFGGWLMGQMDLAAYYVARKYARTKLATVASDNIVFHKPVFVGDCVICVATIEKVGTTSMTIKIDTYVERGADGTREKVTEGRFVFVAIDKDRKPIPIVPPSSPITGETPPALPPAPQKPPRQPPQPPAPPQP